MATTYLDQANLSIDATFVKRVQACLVANAKFIANTSTETIKRQNLAYLILGNPAPYASVFAVGVATDVTVAEAAGSPQAQATVTDLQINAAIAAIYNMYVQPA